MQTIRLQPIAHQTLKVRLEKQNFSVSLYQKAQGIFADVCLSNKWQVRMVPCLNLTPIICRDYAGALGQFMIVDTEGKDDPRDYRSLGTRWQMLYLSQEEYDAITELHLR